MVVPCTLAEVAQFYGTRGELEDSNSIRHFTPIAVFLAVTTEMPILGLDDYVCRTIEVWERFMGL